MPPINKYKCSKCTFEFPEGWGGYFYVIDKNGKREIAPHPIEDLLIQSILGDNCSKEDYINRTGFNSYCVCQDCHSQFELDLGSAETANHWRAYYNSFQKKDERICPKCNSINVITVFEAIGKECPKCNEGTIMEIETGTIC